MRTSYEQSTYMKIYHLIANDISVGVYKTGDIIPTQIMLAEKYNVSRATISEAIKELSRRKLIKTQQGKGTFVIAKPLEIGNFKRFEGFSSFRNMHMDRNLTSKVIDVSLIGITEKIAQKLNAPGGAMVWRVCRVRYIDGTPMSHETSYLLQSYLNGIDLREENLETGSLYSVLREKAGVEFSFSIDKVKALYCPAEIAKHLEISQSEPALMINRVCGIDEECLVEYVDIVERSDISYTIFQSSRAESSSVKVQQSEHTPNRISIKIRDGLVGAALVHEVYGGEGEAAQARQQEFILACLRQGKTADPLELAHTLCTPEDTTPIALLQTVLPAAFLFSSGEQLTAQAKKLFGAFYGDDGESDAAAAYLAALHAAMRPETTKDEILLQATSIETGGAGIDLKKRIAFAQQLVEQGGLSEAANLYFSIIGSNERLETIVPLLLGLFHGVGENYVAVLKESIRLLGSSAAAGLLGALIGTAFSRSTFPGEDIKRIKNEGGTFDGLAARMATLREEP